LSFYLSLTEGYRYPQEVLFSVTYVLSVDIRLMVNIAKRLPFQPALHAQKRYCQAPSFPSHLIWRNFANIFVHLHALQLLFLARIRDALSY
jgi:hypothetical protein